MANFELMINSHMMNRVKGTLFHTYLSIHLHRTKLVTIVMSKIVKDPVVVAAPDSGSGWLG